MATPTPSPTPAAPVPVPSIPPVGGSSGSPIPKPSVTTSPNLPGGGTTSGSSTGTKTVPAAGPASTLTYQDLIPVYDATTKRWTTAYVDGTGEKWAAMLADPNSPTGYSISTDQVATRLQTMQNLTKQYGSLQAAKKAMAEQGLYQLAGVSAKVAQASVNSSTEDDAFDKVLDTSIGAISRTNLLNNGKNVTDVASYISGRPNYAGTKNTSTISETSKDSAWIDIDAFMRKTAGRAATLAEYQNYYNNLNAYEKQHPIKATVTRDALGTETSRVQTEGPSQEDKQAILVAATYDSLLKEGKDPSSISKIGGDVAVAMQKLNQQAADYGVANIYDSTKAFSSALNSILPGGTIDGELTKITALAKATPKYKAYAPMFDAGFTLRDIAKPGMDTANKLLETSTPLQVDNPIMQKYLTGGPNGGQMDDNSFVKYIKSDPTLGWSKTNNARDEAASYATTILKQFGFLG